MPQDAEFPSIARAYRARRKLTRPLENTVFMILAGLVTLLLVGLVGTVWDSHTAMARVMRVGAQMSDDLAGTV
jgi:hypothetical protein